MADIIHLLPDSIANQIAAGEVIQRPASVIKELVENSLDAGASNIQIIIKDAGRTLIQVIDNGKGMSATDARMAFERHATSKIKSADDLFALHTMGFRGEALASIAAIALVEVKTKREEDEVGTQILMSGSRIEKQEAVSATTGTTISVKNIFFNVPARRKFLKSNETERRNIFTEIERMVLVNPHVEFTLIENDVETLHLNAGGLRQRILQMGGKHVNQQLIDIEMETTLGKIYGYIGRPEFAKKGKTNQFFFANNRYIRHPYFHKAVMMAFEPLIAPNTNPHYYIYLEVDPSTIDVNIHPTKTEVKFENERELWQILMVTVKESLGRNNAIPSIDFDTKDAIDIPIYNPLQPASAPTVHINPAYNPFNATQTGQIRKASNSTRNWETLYGGLEKQHSAIQLETPPTEDESSPSIFGKTSESEVALSPEYYQYKQRFILTSVKSGLMCIDQHRAHIRILFDRYIEEIRERKGITQRLLFPEVLELSAAEAAILPSIHTSLESLGFEINAIGNQSFAIQGVPSSLENPDASALIRSMIERSEETALNVEEEVQNTIALSMAKLTAIPKGQTLNADEMLLLVNQLFASPTPNHTPDGKKIIVVLDDHDIDNKFR